MWNDPKLLVGRCVCFRLLAEKHQELLRKFDRESKANKRLSMDKEELMWKLNLGPGEVSPDVHRRSVGHSPKSTDFPDFTQSQQTSSPRPCSSRQPPAAQSGTGASKTTASSAAAAAEVSSTTPPQRIGVLHRSGTYDLLNQEFDDDELVFSGPFK